MSRVIDDISHQRAHRQRLVRARGFSSNMLHDYDKQPFVKSRCLGA
jgi:hypothetical protein